MSFWAGIAKGVEANERERQIDETRDERRAERQEAQEWRESQFKYQQKRDGIVDARADAALAENERRYEDAQAVNDFNQSMKVASMVGSLGLPSGALSAFASPGNGETNVRVSGPPGASPTPSATSVAGGGRLTPKETRQVANLINNIDIKSLDENSAEAEFWGKAVQDPSTLLQWEKWRNDNNAKNPSNHIALEDLPKFIKITGVAEASGQDGFKALNEFLQDSDSVIKDPEGFLKAMESAKAWTPFQVYFETKASPLTYKAKNDQKLYATSLIENTMAKLYAAREMGINPEEVRFASTVIGTNEASTPFAILDGIASQGLDSSVGLFKAANLIIRDPDTPDKYIAVGDLILRQGDMNVKDNALLNSYTPVLATRLYVDELNGVSNEGTGTGTVTGNGAVTTDAVTTGTGADIGANIGANIDATAGNVGTGGTGAVTVDAVGAGGTGTTTTGTGAVTNLNEDNTVKIKSTDLEGNPLPAEQMADIVQNTDNIDTFRYIDFGDGKGLRTNPYFVDPIPANAAPALGEVPANAAPALGEGPKPDSIPVAEVNPRTGVAPIGEVMAGARSELRKNPELDADVMSALESINTNEGVNANSIAVLEALVEKHGEEAVELNMSRVLAAKGLTMEDLRDYIYSSLTPAATGNTIPSPYNERYDEEPYFEDTVDQEGLKALVESVDNISPAMSAFDEALAKRPSLASRIADVAGDVVKGVKSTGNAAIGAVLRDQGFGALATSFEESALTDQQIAQAMIMKAEPYNREAANRPLTIAQPDNGFQQQTETGRAAPLREAATGETAYQNPRDADGEPFFEDGPLNPVTDIADDIDGQLSEVDNAQSKLNERLTEIGEAKVADALSKVQVLSEEVIDVAVETLEDSIEGTYGNGKPVIAAVLRNQGLGALATAIEESDLTDQQIAQTLILSANRMSRPAETLDENNIITDRKGLGSRAKSMFGGEKDTVERGIDDGEITGPSRLRDVSGALDSKLPDFLK